MAKAARKAEKPTPVAVTASRTRPTVVPDAKPEVADLSREDELRAFETMLLIRRFEERAGQMYGMGLIGGFCHLYIGQEAVVVGMQMAIGDGDQVITTYRDHGHMLACGKIGRASCRERVEISGGAGALKEKKSRERAGAGVQS